MARGGLRSLGCSLSINMEDDMLSESIHLNIGSLLFKNLDQTDLTGPFEVLSRLPNATHRIYAKSMDPVRDMMGLRLTPDATLAVARSSTSCTFLADLARRL